MTKEQALQLNCLTERELENFKRVLALAQDDQINDPVWTVDWIATDWDACDSEDVPQDYQSPWRDCTSLTLVRGENGDEWNFDAEDLARAQIADGYLHLPGVMLILRAPPAEPTGFPAEVAQRRIEQDAKHGGPGHDDTHVPHDWSKFIDEYASTLDHASYWGAESPYDYRQTLVDIAALAQAAAESYDRIEARNAASATNAIQ